MIHFIDFLKERSQGCIIFSLIIVAIMLLWTVVGVDTHHAHTWAEKQIPLFWSLFTVVSAVVLIFVAGFVGKNIETRENYYDE